MVPYVEGGIFFQRKMLCDAFQRLFWPIALERGLELTRLKIEQ